MERNPAEITQTRSSCSWYIQYNRQRDLPLLLAIRNATFICHRQLWEHLYAIGIETSRRSFNWRIERLTRAGVTEKLPRLLRIRPRSTRSRALVSPAWRLAARAWSASHRNRDRSQTRIRCSITWNSRRFAQRFAELACSGIGPAIPKSDPLTSRSTCRWRRITTRLRTWNGRRGRTELQSNMNGPSNPPSVIATSFPQLRASARSGWFSISLRPTFFIS